MTQLSNVPMQPNPSAVERTLTLIEKLEEYHQLLYERWCDNHKHPYDEGAMDAVEKAIEIVKQHSDWVSAEEELPVLEYECGFRSFEPTKFYQLIDNEGGLHNAYFSTNHYPNDDRALFTLCELDFYNGKWIVDDEYEVITIEMVKLWKPLQPPSEVQA